MQGTFEVTEMMIRGDKKLVVLYPAGREADNFAITERYLSLAVDDETYDSVAVGDVVDVGVTFTQVTAAEELAEEVADGSPDEGHPSFVRPEDEPVLEPFPSGATVNDEHAAARDDDPAADRFGPPVAPEA